MYKHFQCYPKHNLFILLSLVLVERGIAQIKPDTKTSVSVKTGNTTSYLPGRYSASSGNYIRVSEPQQQGFTDAAGVINSTSVTDVNKSTQYFDGLGRPLQTVSWKVSPDQKDIVATIVYDELGREQYKFLPYKATTADGSFQTNPFNDQKTFYSVDYLSDQPAYNGEQYYYSHTQFESSPLNRPLKTFAPGNSWAGSEGGIAEKAVSIQYLINNSSDHVRVWDIGFDAFSDGNNIPASAAEYDTGQLYKTVTINEHNNAVVEYKDKEGRVVLKKVQIGNISADYSGYNGFLSTFYVYDALSQLRFVIPPKAVAQMIAAANWTLTTTIVNELCFRYEYDERQRIKAKKVPGAYWVYMVYDNRDRLCFTQDGNLRSKQQWMYTLYEDDLNRVAETGIVKYPGTWSDLITAAGTTSVNTTAADVVVNLRNNTVNQYTATNSITFNDGFVSEAGANFTAEIVKALSYSSQTGNPGATLSGGSWYPLTYTYYDNYDFGTTKSYSTTNSSKLDNSINNYLATLEDVPTAKSVMTKGMVTGTRVRVIENPDNLDLGAWLETVNFYDDKGRPVQVQADNYKGGKDIVTTRYNFTNKAVGTYLEHTNPAATDGTNSIDVNTSILYDHAGRATKTTKQLIYQSVSYSRTIAQNVYDALGQLKNKKIGQKSATDATEIENDQYSYNIRGWLKGVNYYNGTTYSSQESSASNKWFAFDLGYDWGMTSSQYNGNIAGMRWKSAGDNKERAYGYAYDQANRLLSADFTQYNTAWGTDSLLNFKVKIGDGTTVSSAYDENGNIKRMQQWGLAGTASQQIDDLMYTYAASGGSNKLLQVTDNGVQPVTNIGDFKDKNTGSNDYGYDVNGNLITDKNKRINGVTDIDQTTPGAIIYNHLNLPYQISVSNDDGSAKGTITYIYDAAGNKLEKRTVEGTKQTMTAYLGGFVYENNKLQFLGQEEGRIRALCNNASSPATVSSFAYDYFLKDHLGNVRMVLTDEQPIIYYPAATVEGTYDVSTNSMVNYEKRFYRIDNTKIIPESSIASWVSPTETVANTKLYYNNNGNPPANTSYPIGCTPVQTAGSNNVYKLNATANRTGLEFMIKVMAGDKVDIFGKSYYLNTSAITNANSTPLDVLSLMTNLLLTPSNPASVKGFSASQLNTVNSGIIPTSFFRGSNNEAATTIPKAYINYIFFDDQFKYAGGGASRVGSNGIVKDHWYVDAAQLQNIIAPKNGYIFVYVSNESNIDVFFDNLQVTHKPGPLLEETHYYPFGLTMSGISSKAAGSLQNRYKFNGGNELQSQEFSDGSGLEIYDSKYRMYDPQIGKFLQVDPLEGISRELSPFAFGNNNPISLNDPLGLSATTPGVNPENKDDNANLGNVTVTTRPKPKFNWLGLPSFTASQRKEAKHNQNLYYSRTLNGQPAIQKDDPSSYTSRVGVYEQWDQAKKEWRQNSIGALLMIGSPVLITTLSGTGAGSLILRPFVAATGKYGAIAKVAAWMQFGNAGADLTYQGIKYVTSGESINLGSTFGNLYFKNPLLSSLPGALTNPEGNFLATWGRGALGDAIGNIPVPGMSFGTRLGMEGFTLPLLGNLSSDVVTGKLHEDAVSEQK